MAVWAGQVFPRSARALGTKSAPGSAPRHVVQRMVAPHMHSSGKSLKPSMAQSENLLATSYLLSSEISIQLRSPCMREPWADTVVSSRSSFDQARTAWLKTHEPAQVLDRVCALFQACAVCTSCFSLDSSSMSKSSCQSLGYKSVARSWADRHCREPSTPKSCSLTEIPRCAVVLHAWIFLGKPPVW